MIELRPSILVISTKVIGLTCLLKENILKFPYVAKNNDRLSTRDPAKTQ